MTAPEDVGIGIQTMVETFQRLGLMWRLVKGTVFDAANTPTLTLVTFDTDDDPSNCISMIGQVAAGTRVYVMVVPPQGNYIIGLGSYGSIINENGVGAASATDSTTSATYVNMAGASTSFSFTKASSGTRLKATMNVGAFISGAANTRPGFAVQIGSTDYDVVGMTINPLATHTINAGFVYLSGIAAGTYTVQGRWRRISGTGTLARNSEDPVAISILELP